MAYNTNISINGLSKNQFMIIVVRIINQNKWRLDYVGENMISFNIPSANFNLGGNIDISITGNVAYISFILNAFIAFNREKKIIRQLIEAIEKERINIHTENIDKEEQYLIDVKEIFYINKKRRLIELELFYKNIAISSYIYADAILILIIGAYINNPIVFLLGERGWGLLGWGIILIGLFKLLRGYFRKREIIDINKEILRIKIQLMDNVNHKV